MRRKILVYSAAILSVAGMAYSAQQLREAPKPADAKQICCTNSLLCAEGSPCGSQNCDGLNGGACTGR